MCSAVLPVILNLFLFLLFPPPPAPSALDEGWTCAELHLCRAGLGQQDHSSRWACRALVGYSNDSNQGWFFFCISSLSLSLELSYKA